VKESHRSHDNTLNQDLKSLRLVAFDFDGVFTDNAVYVLEDGREAVRCWRGDGIGLRRLGQLGISTIVISTETNAVVTARSAKLGTRCIQGCEDKLTVLGAIAVSQGIPLSLVAFVGNDVNDLACLLNVGFPIVVKDAHPDVVGCAKYQTTTPGGFGAVREVCDLIAIAHRPKEG